MQTQQHDTMSLLLPLGERVGALQKVRGLIDEMNHPNTDWKFVVSGLRSYLFEYLLHDVEPYAQQVLPVVFRYLREATERKKATALRACDTFFDRYDFVVKNYEEHEYRLDGILECFRSFAPEYIDLLLSESDEEYYLENVNSRILRLKQNMDSAGLATEAIMRGINDLIISQYSIYIKNAITTDVNEISGIRAIIEKNGINSEIITLLESVSEKSYTEHLKTGKITAEDFSHNASAWERVCVLVKKSIEQGLLSGDNDIIALLDFLIKKSYEGNNADLQLSISRSVASVCRFIVENKKHDLLKKIISMVMPPLLSEIERKGNYSSAFSTIYNVGKQVIESGDIHAIDFFEDMLIKSKFCFPEYSGIAQDWSVIVNSSHLENIRTWMKLIEINPPVMRKLSASLIVNLKLGGVFLKDTDVFQRDISSLLNSDYGTVFYLIISLASVFPAFYHDIGATGNIRAFTEKIDTNHSMDDLIHFLRKQVHVESSSQTVNLIQVVMEFWMTGNRTLLHKMVPEEVYANLDRFFHLVNLDIENVPKRIVHDAKKHFREHRDERFWDFLNEVGSGPFLEFVRSGSFRGVSEKEKEKSLEYFEEYFDARSPTEMTKILHYIKNKFGIDISKTMIWKFLYEISDDDFRNMFRDVGKSDISRINVEKFITFLHVYRMLYDKYNLSEIRAIEKLEQYARENLFDPPEDFFESIRSNDQIFALEKLLEFQLHLKNTILLSGNVFEPLDTIEFKRHIAFGIPSMYGSYKEKKFDTLKVFFHMNLIREGLFESIIETMSSRGRAELDFSGIKKMLILFHKTLVIDGLANQEMLILIDLLESPNMTVSQFRDIITHLLTTHGEISDRFNETFKYVSRESIKNIGLDKIDRKYIPEDQPLNIDIIMDRFMRDQIMQSPLLQLLDMFLVRIKEHLAKYYTDRNSDICLNSIKGNFVRGTSSYMITSPPDLHPGDKLYAPIWKIGGKAHGLLFAANISNINVPEGFVLSSEIYRRIRDGNADNPRFRRKILYTLKKHIDRFSGNRFANPENPVLFSVRSGAVFSMPGVMDTITNVGITQEMLDRLAQRDPWFAYDCFRRLIQDLAISTYGIDRSVFENIMTEAKEQAGVPLKEMLTGRQMELLTRKYRYTINKYGYSIPKDPYEQLYYAILAVYRSWESNLAGNYRDFVNISDDWGTAVIVQKMVFGNYTPSDITGVVYSQDVGRENIGLFGEYKTRAQGHDIVSGVAKVFPISQAQKEVYEKLAVYPSLEQQFPVMYRSVFDAVNRIRDLWGNDVEIEFTFQNSVLYILQIRGMTKHIFETEELAETPKQLKKYLLGQGLAASGGAISGRIVFDSDKIDILRDQYKGDNIILARPETNPEDVVGLKKSDGILTCIGGMTSHAVLQMRRLEKCGVSDFSMMRINEENNTALVKSGSPEKKDMLIREGDHITIDGNTGNVYLGYHKTIRRRL